MVSTGRLSCHTFSQMLERPSSIPLLSAQPHATGFAFALIILHQIFKALRINPPVHLRSFESKYKFVPHDSDSEVCSSRNMPIFLVLFYTRIFFKMKIFNSSDQSLFLYILNISWFVWWQWYSIRFQFIQGWILGHPPDYVEGDMIILAGVMRKKIMDTRKVNVWPTD